MEILIKSIITNIVIFIIAYIGEKGSLMLKNKKEEEFFKTIVSTSIIIFPIQILILIWIY